jgi:hypothetical protein
VERHYGQDDRRDSLPIDEIEFRAMDRSRFGLLTVTIESDRLQGNRQASIFVDSRPEALLD